MRFVAAALCAYLSTAAIGADPIHGGHLAVQLVAPGGGARIAADAGPQLRFAAQGGGASFTLSSAPPEPVAWLTVATALGVGMLVARWRRAGRGR